MIGNNNMLEIDDMIGIDNNGMNVDICDVDIVAVVGADDEPFAQWILDQTHDDIVIVDVAPTGYATPAVIADALLSGLGKNSALAGRTVAAEQLTHAWLSLNEHTDVIIVDAHLLPVAALETCVAQYAASGLRTWLVCTHPPDVRVEHSDLGQYLDLVRDRRGATIDTDTFRRHLDSRTAAGGGHRRVDGGQATARLPLVDGIAFRSACKQLLEPDHAAAVDTEFVDTVHALRAEFADINGPHKTRAIARKLRSRLRRLGTVDDIVLTVRSAQVAALPLGFHIAVDTTHLVGAAAHHTRLGRADHEHWWDQLDTYRDPAIGAICALHLHEFDWDRIVDLTCGDVITAGDRVAVLADQDEDNEEADVNDDGDDDGDGDGDDPAAEEEDEEEDEEDEVDEEVEEEEVVVEDLDLDLDVDGYITISGPCGRFLRAQLELRRVQGAQPDERLLISHRSNHIHRSYIPKALNAPTAELGIDMSELQSRSGSVDATTWLRRYGITITKLTYTSTTTNIAN